MVRDELCCLRARVRSGGALIRKTSLLHKIEPTARRSSFADICTRRDLRRGECNGDSAPSVTCDGHWALGSISSSRCQISRTSAAMPPASEKCFPRTSIADAVAGRAVDWTAVWWSQTGSNRRPPACKAGALPTELWPRASQYRLTFRISRLAVSAGLPSRNSRAIARLGRIAPKTRADTLQAFGASAFAALARAKAGGPGKI